MARIRSLVDIATSSLTRSCSSVRDKMTRQALPVTFARMRIRCHLCTCTTGIIRHPPQALTVFHLIPDGIFCEGHMSRMSVWKHPPHRQASPPHRHVTWIYTKETITQAALSFLFSMSLLLMRCFYLLLLALQNRIE